MVKVSGVVVRALVVIPLTIGPGHALSCGNTPSTDPGDGFPTRASIMEAVSIAQIGRMMESVGFKMMCGRTDVRYPLPAAAFKQGSADLSQALQKKLDELVEILRTQDKYRTPVVIIGEGDRSPCAGTTVGDILLAESRAESVRTYLSAQGIDKKLIETDAWTTCEQRRAN